MITKMAWKIIPIPALIYVVLYLLPFLLVIAISVWRLKRGVVRRQDWLAIIGLELGLMSITMSMMRF